MQNRYPDYYNHGTATDKDEDMSSQGMMSSGMMSEEMSHETTQEELDAYFEKYYPEEYAYGSTADMGSDAMMTSDSMTSSP